MKKLLSFSALYALLYAMPTSANFLFGEIFSRTYIKGSYLIEGNYLPIVIALLICVLIVEAFLLRLALDNASYARTLIAITVGNIPSLILGAIMPYVSMTNESMFGFFLLTICNPLLILITIALSFHYPMQRLILPIFLGNLIACGVGVFLMLEITGFH